MNENTEQRVAIVTGASRGLGLAVSRLLARKGWRVFGASRTARQTAQEAGLENLSNIQMDVTSDESVNNTVNTIISETGRIDLLVNNAGISVSGPVEETPIETVRVQFETNYFGAVRMTKAVLAHMRERGTGIICNVGSVAGKIGLPFQAHYSASKFAIEGLSEALAIELDPFGIRVILIEPGDVKTTIWQDRKECVLEESPYARAMGCFLDAKEREMGPTGKATPPDQVARQIYAAIEKGGKRLRFGVSKNAGLMLAARKILPDFVMSAAVKKNYGQ